MKFLKLKSRDHTVSFTLNTTYGLNLILHDLNPAPFKKIVTSEIEHNSPFLSTISFSERTGLPREVIQRNEDGSIPLDATDFEKAIVMVNCVSNFDGRELANIKDLVKTVHKAGGLIIIDAAQAMAHSSHLLEGTDADAICFSAHKMYAPSLGVIVWKNSLASYLKPSFIGGGMVDDVDRDSYLLSFENPEHRYTFFESGLQAWGEIVALGAAIDWLSGLKKKDHENLTNNTKELYDFLRNSDKVEIFGSETSTTMSFYVKGLDSHLLGEALSRENIMARTGYFCVHYYLDHVLHLPPLVRFSLGYHNRPADIEKVKQTLKKVIY